MHLPRYALSWSCPALGIVLALAFAWRVLAADTGHPPLAEFAMAWGTVLASLLAGVAALRSRLPPALACMLQAGALATAGGAMGLQPWHLVFKPLAMVCAMAAVAWHMRRHGTWREGGLLLAALAASLAGDVLLMLDGLFIAGLLAFLLAHLCYLALFQQGQRWFALRGALALFLLLAAAMYAFLWHGGLPANLRLPVAAYVLAIALMAAQAWGRWHQARPAGRRAALLVALGAASFLLSDALLATDRFVQPLAWAPLAVLSSYYLAQASIVAGMLCAPRPQASSAGRAGGITPR
ncbi:lysoplasmalogenase [Comamonas endophytica]|uniref:Lysoplasmalogenase n=1 Tax=Comamonas endophytica TaxID=2949090 RepID=A0ABY6G616_9BURK|nr:MULTISPECIES: lysoplasmalogenase [unclassified Acidovorax]MCD2511043.1 lysoplasmalogenase [Acidovorax sp. D4N7]UYG50450.1 lysoplasmalogenase [Acidovorax sp. 5MLIR]